MLSFRWNTERKQPLPSASAHPVGQGHPCGVAWRAGTGPAGAGAGGESYACELGDGFKLFSRGFMWPFSNWLSPLRAGADSARTSLVPQASEHFLPGRMVGWHQTLPTFRGLWIARAGCQEKCLEIHTALTGFKKCGLLFGSTREWFVEELESFILRKLSSEFLKCKSHWEP